MKVKSIRCGGFTLIELVVTIALVAVLMTLAAPTFTTFQRNAELTSRINSLLAVINAARSEAMKRGTYAMVVPISGDWAQGMRVFIDKNNNQVYDLGTDILVYETTDVLPNYLSYSHSTNSPAAASTPYIRFNSLGYPKPIGSDNTNFTLSLARNDTTASEVYNQTRRLMVAVTGRARTCKPASSSDATCTSASSN